MYRAARSEAGCAAPETIHRASSPQTPVGCVQCAQSGASIAAPVPNPQSLAVATGVDSEYGPTRRSAFAAAVLRWAGFGDTRSRPSAGERVRATATGRSLRGP